MNKHKLGFTLIEILSVVLIVAMLTAVALPQYRKSIRRAEAMEALVNVRTIFDSAKRYKVANSEAPLRLRGLDVEFFDASNMDNSEFTIGKFTYKFDNTGVQACRINDGGYCLHFYYKYENGTMKDRDVLVCEVVDSNAIGEWLCNSLSNKKQNSDYIIE